MSCCLTPIPFCPSLRNFFPCISDQYGAKINGYTFYTNGNTTAALSMLFGIVSLYFGFMVDAESSKLDARQSRSIDGVVAVGEDLTIYDFATPNYYLAIYCAIASIFFGYVNATYTANLSPDSNLCYCPCVQEDKLEQRLVNLESSLAIPRSHTQELEERIYQLENRLSYLEATFNG